MAEQLIHDQTRELAVQRSSALLKVVFDAPVELGADGSASRSLVNTASAPPTHPQKRSRPSEEAMMAEGFSRLDRAAKVSKHFSTSLRWHTSDPFLFFRERRR